MEAMNEIITILIVLLFTFVGLREGMIYLEKNNNR